MFLMYAVFRKIRQSHWIPGGVWMANWNGAWLNWWTFSWSNTRCSAGTLGYGGLKSIKMRLYGDRMEIEWNVLYDQYVAILGRRF